MCAYGPEGERSREEREAFWESLNIVLRGFEGVEKLCVLGDMDTKVGDREMRDVVGSFGLEGLFG